MKTLNAKSRGEFGDLRARVARIVSEASITDLHTHLFSPAFGPLLLWGVDEVITYHYLLAEVLRVSNIPYGAFWALSKREQAGLVWDELFIRRSPVSESCRGVLTVLEQLGLDTSARDLGAHRAYFEGRGLVAHVDTVFKTANLKCAVMTNDPFDPAERAIWEAGLDRDPRFRAALRIDPLLTDWGGACPKLQGWEYNVEPALRSKALSEIRRFLEDWTKRMEALYMAVSLPPDFTFPEDSPRATILRECVLPVAREHNLPFAMMIGVKRNVHPELQLAADGVGKADVDAVARLCAGFPENKFMVTMLARENQHELCVAARKFRNLFLFGCWWFLNDPSLIEEITRMRVELLGLSFAPQHSDARVLEQVIYKWRHSRAVIAKVLADKYADLAQTGWHVGEEDIRRDVGRLFGGNFWAFLEQ